MNKKNPLFISICIISFMGPFLSTSLTISLPQIGLDFSVAPESVSWVLSSYLIATTALLLPMGKLADLKGRRKVYAGALLVLFASTIGGGFSQDFFGLVVFRVIQGMALSAIYVSYMPLLLTTTDEEHQGQTLGAAVALTYLGLSMGPAIGGYLTEHLGWRAIFFISAVPALLSWLPIRSLKEEWYGEEAPFVNIVSSILCISAIGLFLYGVSSYIDYPGALWAGILLLVVFLVHEGYSRHPLLPLQLFCNLPFTLSNVAALTQYSATYAISFLLSLYLQLSLALSPAQAGMILLAQPIMMALLSRRAGMWADRRGSQWIASAGMAITALALLGFSFFSSPSIEVVVVFLLMTGIGSALFGAPNNSSVMSAVEPAQHGIASSLLALVRHFGQALSMAIVTIVFSLIAHNGGPYDTLLVEGIHDSFIFMAICCALGIGASLKR
jgi:MFS family permease